MRAPTPFAPRLPLALPLALLLAACGATLTRGPAGWHESPSPYSVAPLENGALFPAGWALDGYAVEKNGFRRTDDGPASPDFKLKRIEDDGVLLVTHDQLVDEDAAKRPDVLADRWIERIVRSPKTDDDATELFAPVVPRLETTASGTVGFGFGAPIVTTTTKGRTVQVDSRETFPLPGADGSELTATLAPLGASPDRRLYLAVIKQSGSSRYAVIAYGNTPTMFERGLADAAAFAHRLRF